MIAAIIVFALTYVLMLTFSKYRPYIALASGLIFIVSGMLPLDQVLGTLDFNVLLMIAGTMGLVALFIESKMPQLLADIIMEKVPNVQIAAVALALFAGIISAFVDNVATVLMIAPVAVAVCNKSCTFYYRYCRVFQFTGGSYFGRRYNSDYAWLCTEYELYGFLLVSGKTFYFLCGRAGCGFGCTYSGIYFP